MALKSFADFGDHGWAFSQFRATILYESQIKQRNNQVLATEFESRRSLSTAFRGWESPTALRGTSGPLGNRKDEPRHGFAEEGATHRGASVASHSPAGTRPSRTIIAASSIDVLNL